jgi:hypothetical protein
MATAEIKPPKMVAPLVEAIWQNFLPQVERHFSVLSLGDGSFQRSVGLTFDQASFDF